MTYIFPKLLIFLLFIIGLISCERLPSKIKKDIIEVVTNELESLEEEEPSRPLLKNYLPSQHLGDELIRHRYYTVSYVSKNKNPEWAAYELTAERVNKEAARRRHGFVADPGTDESAHASDYKKSGYDRGHLVPAEDMDFSEQAMAESFFLTNISPQDPHFNRGIWKTLENHVRIWAKANQHIYVITGPVLRKRLRSDSKQIGDGVEVPRSFYKVILDYSGPEKKGIAFLMDNKKLEKKLVHYACSIQEVEEKTGINFFPELSAAASKKLEQQFDVSLWKMD